MDNVEEYPKNPKNREEALQTLAAFARTAPGRLPERVSIALTIAAEKPTIFQWTEQQDPTSFDPSPAERFFEQVVEREVKRRLSQAGFLGIDWASGPDQTVIRFPGDEE